MAKESKMANSKTAIGTLLAALIVASPAWSQDLDGTLKKIKDSATFTLGYLESAPPFSFPGPDRRPVGYSIDLCTHVASAIQKQLGINLKLNWAPVTTDNRLEMVASGKVDIDCGTTTANLSRQERVDFSLMTFVDGGGLLTKSDLKLGATSDPGGQAHCSYPWHKDPNLFALPNILFSYEPYGFMVRRNDA